MSSYKIENKTEEKFIYMDLKPEELVKALMGTKEKYELVSVQDVMECVSRAFTEKPKPDDCKRLVKIKLKEIK